MQGEIAYSMSFLDWFAEEGKFIARTRTRAECRVGAPCAPVRYDVVNPHARKIANLHNTLLQASGSTATSSRPPARIGGW